MTVIVRTMVGSEVMVHSFRNAIARYHSYLGAEKPHELIVTGDDPYEHHFPLSNVIEWSSFDPNNR